MTRVDHAQRLFPILLGLLLLLSACIFTNPSSHKERTSLFTVHSHNFNSIAAQKVDSIYLYGFNANLLATIDSLLATMTDQSRPYLFARKVSILSRLGRLEEAKAAIAVLGDTHDSTFVKIAFHDYGLYSNSDTLDIAVLKNLLKIEIDWFPKVSLLNRIGRYYYDVDFDLDSSRHYYQLSAIELEKNEKITTEHFHCYQSLVLLCQSQRRNLEGILYANLLCDFSKYLNEPDSLTKARAFLIRASMLFREKDLKGSLLDNQLAKQLIDSCINVKEYQEYLKNELVFLYGTPSDSGKINTLLQQLETSVNRSGYDYCNYNRLKSNMLVYRGAHKAALVYLKPALLYEQRRQFFNPRDFSNVCYLFKDCYLAVDDYAEALRYMQLNSQHLGGRNPSNQKVKPYTFTSNLEAAEIYFEKYKVTHAMVDLYQANELLALIDQKMIAEYKVSDEQSILQFYAESGVDFFQLGMQVSFELYSRTNDKRYALNFVRFSDKKKSSLMYRDLQMANLIKNTSQPFFVKRQQITSRIKEELLKGARNNERFNAVVKEQLAVENELARHAALHQKSSIQNAIVEQDIAEIQRGLGQEELVLDLSHFGNNIYFTLINSAEIQLIRLELTDRDLQNIDQYLLSIQSGKQDLGLRDKVSRLLLPNNIRNQLRLKMYVAPDGIFHQISLPELLGEEFMVTYVPALKFLKQPSQHLSPRKPKYAIFAFSDIETIRSSERTRLIELPGTFKEAKSLKAIHPDAVLYTGKEATKANFLKAYSDPDITSIHLAVHGIANSANKEDVKLYFRTAAGGLDSLYGYELLRQSSSVTKVVLSACESGKGRYVEGEGTYSLARYFMINGAKEVVLSMQLVNDNNYEEGRITYRLQ